LPAVLSSRFHRVVALSSVATFVVLSGCSKGATLDHQEQVAFARACASLVERDVANHTPPVRDLNGERLDLDDPASFYSTLEKLRGPSTFDFHDPARADETPKDLLDSPCQPRTAATNPLIPRASTSTTSPPPPTTTAPASPPVTPGS
jgi:hypothetical protein